MTSQPSDPKTGMTVARAKILINDKAIPEYNWHWRAVGFLQGRASLESVVRELIEYIEKNLGCVDGEDDPSTDYFIPCKKCAYCRAKKELEEKP